MPYLTEIGIFAFSGCSYLGQISIPSSVTSISEKAFERCSSLMQISISSYVTKIKDSAFVFLVNAFILTVLHLIQGSTLPYWRTSISSVDED